MEGERIAEYMFQDMICSPKLHFFSLATFKGILVLYSQRTLLAISVAFIVIRLVLVRRERKKLCNHGMYNLLSGRKN